MRKLWLEITLVIIGILLLCSTDPDPKNIAIFKDIGVLMIILAIVLFFIHRGQIKKQEEADRILRNRQKKTDYEIHKKAFYSETPEKIKEETTAASTRNTVKEEESRNRQTKRDEQVVRVGEEAGTKILDRDNIKIFATTSLDIDDVNYIASKVSCPLFGGTIQDVYDKINDITLSDAQIVNILKYGTENLRERFIEIYKNDDSWTMSSSVFDYLMSFNKLLLLQLTNYSAELFTKLINTLGPYELLGYRTEPLTPDETTEGNFNNLITNTVISYYEEMDTDVVYIAEQCFEDNADVRKLAFDKVFAGPCDLVDIIKRLDTFTEYEARKIFERQHEDEITEMLDRNDADDLIEYLSPKYAIKAVLGIIVSDYSDHIKENFDFNEIEKKVWLEIFEELTPDELNGYRMKPKDEDEEPEGYLGGDEDDDEKKGIPYYSTSDDIIKLFEEHLNDDDTTTKLRKLAFEKMSEAHDLTDAIQNWETIMDYEVQKIMERGQKDEMENLFERDDTGDIVEHLPNSYIIKARLGLFDFGDIDDLNSEYDNRMDNAEFKAKVEKLAEALK